MAKSTPIQQVEQTGDKGWDLKTRANIPFSICKRPSSITTDMPQPNFNLKSGYFKTDLSHLWFA